MLEAALSYVAEGWPVFPCNIHKIPLIAGGFKSATTDKEQVREWWTRWPDASIGCPTGTASGILAIDVDLPEGPGSLAALEKEHGILPATMEQRTGSGGRHLLFQVPVDRKIPCSAGRLGKDLDVRSDGGYIILPPSGHPTGGEYGWVKKCKMAEVPVQVLDRMVRREGAQVMTRPATSGATSAYGRKALESEFYRVATAPEKTRNNNLNLAAFALGQLVAGGELDHAEAEAALREASKKAGLGEREAEKTINSGMKAGEQTPRKAPERSVNKGKTEKEASSEVLGASTSKEMASSVAILATKEKADDAWALVRELFPRTVFPWKVLPVAIAESIKQLGRSCATSATPLPAQAICLVAAAVGRKVDVQAKGSWVEPLTFWVADIRESGAGKTSPMWMLAEELTQRQGKEDERFRAEQKAFAMAEPAERVIAPRKCRGYFTTNMTLEGVHADLDEHQTGGLVVLLNELSAFIGGQNQYKSGGTDRESWLALHDGKDARISRARGAVSIKGARVQVVGGIQPAIFRQVFGGGGGQYLDDGTVFRCLFTYEPAFHIELTTETWTEENRKAWGGVLFNAMNWADNQQDPWRLTLSQDALARFIEWRNALDAQRLDLPERFRGFLPKAFGYALRMAGAIHLMERFAEGLTPEAELSLSEMERGIEAVSFYLGQAVDALWLLVSEGRDAATAPAEVSERSMVLAGVLESLRGEVDSGRLAIGFIHETFNLCTKPEEQLQTPRAMGALLKACGLSTSSLKHDANGRRRVNCLEWDAKAESFIKHSLPHLKGEASKSESGADIPKTNVSKVSTAMAPETSETLETSESGSAKGYAPAVEWLWKLLKQLGFPKANNAEPAGHVED